VRDEPEILRHQRTERDEDIKRKERCPYRLEENHGNFIKPVKGEELTQGKGKEEVGEVSDFILEERRKISKSKFQK
jgi:hypothetical protein